MPCQRELAVLIRPQVTSSSTYALRTRGWLAQGLLVLGFLSALLPTAESALHMVLMRHVRCAVHGELMHEGEHRADADHAAPATQGDAVHGDHSSPHKHEHCGHFLPAPSVVSAVGPAVATRMPLDPSAPSTAPPAWAHPAGELLHLSPKTSPPSA